MSAPAKFSLLFIVFVDLLGQGLVFPIVNALIMDPASAFLPHTASDTARHLNYGLVIGVALLYLLWTSPQIQEMLRSPRN